jgi:hypothetical protein
LVAPACAGWMYGGGSCRAAQRSCTADQHLPGRVRRGAAQERRIACWQAFCWQAFSAGRPAGRPAGRLLLGRRAPRASAGTTARRERWMACLCLWAEAPRPLPRGEGPRGGGCGERDGAGEGRLGGASLRAAAGAGAAAHPSWWALCRPLGKPPEMRPLERAAAAGSQVPISCGSGEGMGGHSRESVLCGCVRGWHTRLARTYMCPHPHDQPARSWAPATCCLRHPPSSAPLAGQCELLR